MCVAIFLLCFFMHCKCDDDDIVSCDSVSGSAYFSLFLSLFSVCIQDVLFEKIYVTISQLHATMQPNNIIFVFSLQSCSIFSLVLQPFLSYFSTCDPLHSQQQNNPKKYKKKMLMNNSHFSYLFFFLLSHHHTPSEKKPSIARASTHLFSIFPHTYVCRDLISSHPPKMDLTLSRTKNATRLTSIYT